MGTPFKRWCIMLDSRATYCAELRSAAESYRNRGWSVVPIRGDLDLNQPKAAAVNWSLYQRHLPTDFDLDNWFIDHKYEGLGVVCGLVSSLMVLDFDDSACAL